MEKRISYQQFQSVKSVAKAVDPIQRKICAVNEKIAALVAEKESLQMQADALEAGIVHILGFRVAELVKKVIEPTGATDTKTGKPVKITKYLPTDMVSYDENTKTFVITTPDPECVETPDEVYAEETTSCAA